MLATLGLTVIRYARFDFSFLIYNITYPSSGMALMQFPPRLNYSIYGIIHIYGITNAHLNNTYTYIMMRITPDTLS